MTPSAWWLTLALLGPSDPAAQRMEGTALAAQVREQVQARTYAAGSRARVEVVGRVADQSLPSGAVAVDVGQIAGRWPRARAGVPVRLSVDGRSAHATTVWIGATDERTVYTYLDAYDAGTLATALRTAPARVDMVCCGGEAIANAAEMSGLRLRHAVRAGTPVMREDLAPLPMVAAQQPVAVAVERGPVRIMTQGIALQDGAFGERILVRTQQSRHAVSARVVERGEVVVDE